MSKKISYPAVQRPTSKQDITKAYIQEYYAFQVEAGKITEAQLNEWIEIVDKAEKNNPNNPVKAFNEYRNEFVNRHFAYLNAKQEKTASAYFVSLRSKAKKEEA